MNKEELDLLEIVFTLALGECAYNDINNIQKLEDKIKTIGNLCKKQKEVISRAIELLNNPWSFESGNKEVDEITYNKKRKVIDILKEVSEWVKY